MNISIIEDESKHPICFPCIMESVKQPRILVLFTEENCGVILEGKEHEVGVFSDDWIPASDKSEWKRFYGTVTLSN